MSSEAGTTPLGPTEDPSEPSSPSDISDIGTSEGKFQRWGGTSTSQSNVYFWNSLRGSFDSC